MHARFILRALLGSAVLLALSGGADAAAKLKVIYNFAGGNGDGASPIGPLLIDGHGNLYGTTFAGGSGDNGTVFKISRRGRESVLHVFTGTGGDGTQPLGGVIADKSGNLYSTTASGNGICDCGTVFKLAPDGTITILHAFTGGSDGSHPEAGLVADKNGNLYGTTMNEGAYGSGTVFRIGADGTKTTLHSFNITTDGADPLGSLIIGKDGNLYGTTFDGGPEWTAGGVVFKMTPDGTETVLYNFGLGFRDGQNPMGALVKDRKGNLYGTTSAYGWIGNGTVFRITPDGHEKTLRWFTTLVARHVYPKVGGVRDGYSPSTGLTRDADGNLYGTTSMGGAYKKGNGGTIFAIER